MGRLISDGAFYWYIVDVVVRPEHESAGVGTTIMSALEVVVAERSATGVANLVAGADVSAFYTRLGYEHSGAPVVHTDLATLVALAVAHQDRAAIRVEVTLGQRERSLTPSPARDFTPTSPRKRRP
jgi:hypothetical protein